MLLLLLLILLSRQVKNPTILSLSLLPHSLNLSWTRIKASPRNPTHCPLSLSLLLSFSFLLLSFFLFLFLSFFSLSSLLLSPFLSPFLLLSEHFFLACFSPFPCSSFSGHTAEYHLFLHLPCLSLIFLQFISTLIICFPLLFKKKSPKRTIPFLFAFHLSAALPFFTFLLSCTKTYPPHTYFLHLLQHLVNTKWHHNLQCLSSEALASLAGTLSRTWSRTDWRRISEWSTRLFPRQRTSTTGLKPPLTRLISSRATSPTPVRYVSLILFHILFLISYRGWVLGDGMDD